jgi:hypothetical protein
MMIIIGEISQKDLIHNNKIEIFPIETTIEDAWTETLIEAENKCNYYYIYNNNNN